MAKLAFSIRNFYKFLQEEVASQKPNADITIIYDQSLEAVNYTNKFLKKLDNKQ